MWAPWRCSIPRPTPSGSLTLEDLQLLIAERLPLVPPFRWRLVTVPFDLDYAYWLDDADFDLDFHVRELALPPGGADEKLAEQVARIFARPLDRRASALGALPDPRTPRGTSGRDEQDPSRGHRRDLRQRDHGRPPRSEPRGPRAARHLPGAARPSAQRRRDAGPRRPRGASLSAAAAALDPEGAAQRLRGARSWPTCPGSDWPGRLAAEVQRLLGGGPGDRPA